ncbi:MAG: circadian clock protein KaiA [Pseudanabaenaceae cyanobacterium]
MPSPSLRVCAIAAQAAALIPIRSTLSPERFELSYSPDIATLRDLLQQESHAPPDCLVLLEPAAIAEMLQKPLALPMVLLIDPPPTSLPEATAQVLPPHQLENLATTIETAIAKFLHLQPLPSDLYLEDTIEAQQRRLSLKLKERLGYLGVYYKRDPRQFLRHMAADERQAYLERMRQTYREIVLEYFRTRNEAAELKLNQDIDRFVNMAFFADMSVSQVLEIHMELMDDLAKQLEIEGRHKGVLLDYRITLIDIIAHLSEMYRRSIPREA